MHILFYRYIGFTGDIEAVTTHAIHVLQSQGIIKVNQKSTVAPLLADKVKANMMFQLALPVRTDLHNMHFLSKRIACTLVSGVPWNTTAVDVKQYMLFEILVLKDEMIARSIPQFSFLMETVKDVFCFWLVCLHFVDFTLSKILATLGKVFVC